MLWRSPTDDYLGLPYFKTSLVEEWSTPTHVYAEELPTPESLICKGCGQPASPHGSYQRRYVDRPIANAPVVLHLTIPRAICRNEKCTTSTFLRHRTDEFSGNMTRRCAEYIQNNCFKYPFVRLAAWTGVPESTVRRIADTLIKRLDSRFKIDAPKGLSIDNIYLPSGKNSKVKILNANYFPKRKNHICHTVIYDSETSQIIELLEDSSFDTILKSLVRLPGSEKIKFVTIDMDENYRSVVWVAFGKGVKIIADRWHVIDKINTVIDICRSNLENEQKKIAKEFRIDLKTSEQVLLKKNEARYRDLKEVLDNIPILKSVYENKERLLKVYDAQKKSVAVLRYHNWEAGLSDEVRKIFSGVIKTIKNWHDEIFNYWEFGNIVKKDKKHISENRKTIMSESTRWKGVNSGSAESRNNVIRTINRVGRSYSFRFIRARSIFSTYDVERNFGICISCHYPFKRELKSASYLKGRGWRKFLADRNIRHSMNVYELCSDCNDEYRNVRRCSDGCVGQFSTKIGLSDIWNVPEASIISCESKLDAVERRFRSREKQWRIGPSGKTRAIAPTTWREFSLACLETPSNG